jgi:DDE_Tnp_1-associated
MLTTFLMDVKDFRRPQAQKYKLHDVLLFCILALLCNAKSYRDIHRFMTIHFEDLKKDFSLLWKKPPAYTTIRNIIKGIDASELEAAFRAYTQSLVNYYAKQPGLIQIAVDGKTLCKSFDHFQDKKALQKLMFFDVNEKLILGHIAIAEKTNEIPAVQSLLEELELTQVIYTMDALHCQKKHLTLPVMISYCWFSLKTIKNIFCKMCKPFLKIPCLATVMWPKPNMGMVA